MIKSLQIHSQSEHPKIQQQVNEPTENNFSLYARKIDCFFIKKGTFEGLQHSNMLHYKNNIKHAKRNELGLDLEDFEEDLKEYIDNKKYADLSIEKPLRAKTQYNQLSDNTTDMPYGDNPKKTISKVQSRRRSTVNVYSPSIYRNEIAQETIHIKKNRFGGEYVKHIQQEANYKEEALKRDSKQYNNRDSAQTFLEERSKSQQYQFNSDKNIKRLSTGMYKNSFFDARKLDSEILEGKNEDLDKTPSFQGKKLGLEISSDGSERVQDKMSAGGESATVGIVKLSSNGSDTVVKGTRKFSIKKLKENLVGSGTVMGSQNSLGSGKFKAVRGEMAIEDLEDRFKKVQKKADFAESSKGVVIKNSGCKKQIARSKKKSDTKKLGYYSIQQKPDDATQICKQDLGNISSYSFRGGNKDSQKKNGSPCKVDCAVAKLFKNDYAENNSGIDQPKDIDNTDSKELSEGFDSKFIDPEIDSGSNILKTDNLGLIRDDSIAYSNLDGNHQKIGNFEHGSSKAKNKLREITDPSSRILGDSTGERRDNLGSFCGNLIEKIPEKSYFGQQYHSNDQNSMNESGVLVVRDKFVDPYFSKKQARKFIHKIHNKSLNPEYIGTAVHVNQYDSLRKNEFQITNQTVEVSPVPQQKLVGKYSAFCDKSNPFKKLNKAKSDFYITNVHERVQQAPVLEKKRLFQKEKQNFYIKKFVSQFQKYSKKIE